LGSFSSFWVVGCSEPARPKRNRETTALRPLLPLGPFCLAPALGSSPGVGNHLEQPGPRLRRPRDARGGEAGRGAEATHRVKTSGMGLLALRRTSTNFDTHVVTTVVTEPCSERNLLIIKVAEGVGFEPTVSCPTLVFKTSAFDHSATPPGPERKRSGPSLATEKNSKTRPFRSGSFTILKYNGCAIPGDGPRLRGGYADTDRM
jgi:hypothetical protein